MANQNFRITTNYVLELIRAENGLFYKVIVSGEDGNPTLAVSTVSSSEQELEWEYSTDMLPKVPEDFYGTSNYRTGRDQTLYILNETTGLWHKLLIGGTESNPALSISKNGEVFDE